MTRIGKAKLVWLAGVAVAALFLAACGGGANDDAASSDDHAMDGTEMDGSSEMADDGGGHTAMDEIAEPVEGAPEVEVSAVDIDFEPATLELTAGEPVNVKITNEGETLHDFTLEEADVHVNLEPGETKTTSLTVDEPGTYEAKCTVPGHAEGGMTIDVTVS